MARPKTRLSVFSNSGADPILDLSDDDFRSLEATYGEEISREAREELIAFAESYFHYRITELNVGDFAEVRRMFNRVKKAVIGFQSFAYGELTPHSDAGGTLEGILTHHLSAQTVPIRSDQLLLLDPKSESPTWNEADADGRYLAIRPDISMLMSLAAAMHAVLANAEKDISSNETGEAGRGFSPGDAFRTWLVDMRRWARRHGLRSGPTTAKDEPSPFAHFLFELNRLFATKARGEEWKLVNLSDPVNSAAALADRLKEVRSKLKRNMGVDSAGR